MFVSRLYWNVCGVKSSHSLPAKYSVHVVNVISSKCKAQMYITLYSRCTSRTQIILCNSSICYYVSLDFRWRKFGFSSMYLSYILQTCVIPSNFDDRLQLRIVMAWFYLLVIFKNPKAQFYVRIPNLISGCKSMIFYGLHLVGLKWRNLVPRKWYDVSLSLFHQGGRDEVKLLSFHLLRDSYDISVNCWIQTLWPIMTEPISPSHVQFLLICQRPQDLGSGVTSQEKRCTYFWNMSLPK